MTGPVPIRMDMSADEAASVAEHLHRVPRAVAQRLTDQLWLVAVFVEQRRRTTVGSRRAFTERADRLLEHLDPREDIAPSEVLVT